MFIQRNCALISLIYTFLLFLKLLFYNYYYYLIKNIIYNLTWHEKVFKIYKNLKLNKYYSIVVISIRNYNLKKI